MAILDDPPTDVPGSPGQTPASDSTDTADAAHAELPTSALLAGFIVWLAHQRMPAVQRQRVHREIRDFLSWRDSERTRQAAAIRPSVWCYLQHHRRKGHSDCAQLAAWGALELFMDYTEQSPQGRL